MLLRYRRIEHLLQFEQSLSFPTLPTFLFRSILGKELKRLTCIFRLRPCRECGLKYTCAYSWMFETPLETQPDILEGRDRGSHPFLLAVNIQPWQEVQTLTLTLTVLGKAIEYYPYLFYALQRAGELGVLRERIPFTIQDVRCEGRSILEGSDSIHPTWGIQQWSYPAVQTPQAEVPVIKEAFVGVYLDTPLRLRIEGKYTSLFNARQFFSALYRRAGILCSLYGDSGNPESSPAEDDERIHSYSILNDQIRIVSRDLRWMDLNYYSGRQKKVLKMGGVVGNFQLTGVFQPLEQSLLRFGELFHAGKNTAFGLGKYHIENQ